MRAAVRAAVRAAMQASELAYAQLGVAARPMRHTVVVLTPRVTWVRLPRTAHANAYC